jgi:membrane associated rhomboid family serine protease
VDVLTNGDLLHRYFALSSDLFTKPWQAYQLLTYGFLHDVGQTPGSPGIWHLLMNMLFLYFFGQDVETVYGGRELWKLYFSLLVCSGLVFVLAALASSGEVATVVGASGAVMGLMIVSVMHFPRRKFYFWGVFPVEAWIMATIYVLSDVFALSSQSPVAHSAHLGGALFGFVYFRTKWSLANLLDARVFQFKFRRRPHLKVHQPAQDDSDLNAEVDKILEKISREGEQNLTARERARLEEASRRYQQRKK